MRPARGRLSSAHRFYASKCLFETLCRRPGDDRGNRLSLVAGSASQGEECRPIERLGDLRVNVCLEADFRWPRPGRPPVVGAGSAAAPAARAGASWPAGQLAQAAHTRPKRLLGMQAEVTFDMKEVLAP